MFCWLDFQLIRCQQYLFRLPKQGKLFYNERKTYFCDKLIVCLAFLINWFALHSICSSCLNGARFFLHWTENLLLWQAHCLFDLFDQLTQPPRQPLLVGLMTFWLIFHLNRYDQLVRTLRLACHWSWLVYQVQSVVVRLTPLEWRSWCHLLHFLQFRLILARYILCALLLSTIYFSLQYAFVELYAPRCAIGMIFFQLIGCFEILYFEKSGVIVDYHLVLVLADLQPTDWLMISAFGWSACLMMQMTTG